MGNIEFQLSTFYHGNATLRCIFNQNHLPAIKKIPTSNKIDKNIFLFLLHMDIPLSSISCSKCT